MHSDRLITITTGASRKAVVWLRQELLWSELIAKLGTPMRSTETLSAYMQLPKAQQDDLKDIGGYVAGTLDGSRRKATAVTGRDIITLDLDSIGAGKTAEVLKRIDMLGCGYCVYSTRKHCEAAPRLRVLLPLNRTATADEYEPIARKLAECIGMEMCDPSTFEASRLMYWPSCSADSSYIYTYADKPFTDADGVLTMYSDWHDVRQWAGVSAPKLPRAGKQADPTTKEGVVGAFCRTYDVYRVLSEMLSDIYTPCGDGRYTYAGGSTTGGAVVYNDGAFLYSHHATDPAGGKLCNAFDLVRLHLYADLDDEAKPETPTNRLPSYAAMRRFCNDETDVINRLSTERYDKAVAAFGVAPQETETAYDGQWLNLLEKNGDGAVRKTTDNALIAIEHDPQLRGKLIYDVFSNRCYVLGELPWNRETKRREWRDSDDAGLRYYLEKTINFTGEKKIKDALQMAFIKHSIDAVADYLNSLPEWDGTPRLDTLFIDYLGADDNEYVRAVSRKSFVAAVARALHPGIKYDTMPILVGPQGIGKSTLLRLMGGKWFSDSLNCFKGKDSYEMLQGVWINEVGELAGLNRGESNDVKQFLSKVEDIYRAAYGERTNGHPRRCVFFGTTNDAEFLRDKTGNRRFLPIDCFANTPQKSVFRELASEVPQIWAEALMRYKSGEELYLTGAAEEASRSIQEAHAEPDAREGIINEFIQRSIPLDWFSRNLAQRKMYWASDFGKLRPSHCMERDRICAAEIWCEALGGDFKQMKRGDAIEINRLLRSLDGWSDKAIPIKFGGEYGAQKGFRKDSEAVT